MFGAAACLSADDWVALLTGAEDVSSVDASDWFVAELRTFLGEVQDV